MSHMGELWFSGPGAFDFLQHQLAGDIAGSKPCEPGCLLLIQLASGEHIHGKRDQHRWSQIKDLVHNRTKGCPGDQAPVGMQVPQQSLQGGAGRFQALCCG